MILSDECTLLSGVVDPDSLGSEDPHPDPDSQSGSKKAKLSHKNRKSY